MRLFGLAEDRPERLNPTHVVAGGMFQIGTFQHQRHVVVLMVVQGFVLVAGDEVVKVNFEPFVTRQQVPAAKILDVVAPVYPKVRPIVPEIKGENQDGNEDRDDEVQHTNMLTRARESRLGQGF